MHLCNNLKYDNVRVSYPLKIKGICQVDLLLIQFCVLVWTWLNLKLGYIKFSTFLISMPTTGNQNRKIREFMMFPQRLQDFHMALVCTVPSRESYQTCNPILVWSPAPFVK